MHNLLIEKKNIDMTEIAVVDIETTSLKPWEGSIIEIGICCLNLENGSISKLFDTVVREERFNITTENNAWIFQNSSITAQEILNAPRWEKIRDKLNIIFDRYPVTAYNKQFDFGFLRSRNIIPKKELPCPMILATPILKLPHSDPYYSNYKWPSVEECWDWYFPQIPYIEKHRAYDDCIHEAQIIYKMHCVGHYTF